MRVETVKISVIIPVYNIEGYISDCVKSVCEQSYSNIEIILVNDGSTDNSPNLCEEFAKKNYQIKVIHKANGGLSDARNCGIQAATGDYILFLDGDDFWDDKNAVQKLVERIRLTKVDVLNFSYKKYMEDTKKTYPYFKDVPAMPLNLKTYEKQLDFLTQHNYYIASACNKLIKKSLFTKELLFEKGIYSEDIEWCIRLAMKAKSMDFICENFYCYRQREGSITHTINDKKCTNLKENIIKCIEAADKAEKEIQTSLFRYAAYQYGTFFVVQAQAENIQIDNIKILSQYKWILKYHSGNKKLVVLYLLCKIFGYRRTCHIIRKVYKR